MRLLQLAALVRPPHSYGTISVIHTVVEYTHGAAPFSHTNASNPQVDRSSICGSQLVGRKEKFPDTAWALFSSKMFCKIDTVAFSFIFDKYYPIID